MKVLHVVPAAFGPGGNIGGAERYALGLAREMRTELDVRLAAYSDRSGRIELDGMPIELIPSRAIRGHQFNRLGRGILAPALWADLIHCHQHHILSSSLLGLLGRLTGRPVVATDHGGGGLDISTYINTDRLFSAHLHVSQFGQRQAGQSDLRSSHVIYGGVDAKRFYPAPWDQPRDRVLFVGRLLPHKRVDRLIQALPDGIGLDVMGPFSHPQYAADLRVLAADKNVIFHGPVDEQTLERTYRSALCVVLPSDYDDIYGGHTPAPELLGQVLLEGMASGIPVVCSDAGAMPEVVEDGVTGFVVERRDSAALRSAIHYLAVHQTRAAEIGTQGRTRVLERFTWQAVAEQCIDIYGELLSAKARSTVTLRRLSGGRRPPVDLR